jgi:lipid A 3-O-deacylase
VIKINRLLWIASSLFVFSQPCLASLASQTGVALSYLLVPKDPSKLQGLRGSIWYQPDSFVWQHISVYFDASYGHWWINKDIPYREINIFAVAPVVRFYFMKGRYIAPYAELSIGPSYLSRTRLDDRNLGMHFAFQDQITLGATFGPQKRFSASLTALHYSNGSMCAMNAGITVPVLLNLSYRFG